MHRLALVRLATVASSLAALSVALHAAPGADPMVQQLLTEISAARIEQRVRSLVGFQTRHTSSETASDSRGIGAARRWIERELRQCARDSGGRLEVALDEWVEPAGRRLPQATTLVNVVATLPGSEPTARERMLVVSGHYDSRNSDVLDADGVAPGANDDASGTAVVMELACTMARHRFPATLVFMTVAGEEQGLLGATHWAQRARRDGLRIEAMITDDIVGSPRGDFGQHDARRVRLFADGFDPLLRALVQLQGNRGASEEEARATATWREPLQRLALAGGGADLPTHQLGRHLKQAAEGYLSGFTVQLVQRRDRSLRGGDHLPFLERGFPAVRFTEPFENYAHQHQNVRTEGDKRFGDLLEFVDFAYVADVARVNAAGLATLALAPAAPREATLDASELTNDSTLSWAPNAEADLAGYRVVWRDTDSATWQHARDVGADTTRVTLQGLSKDNVIFGVQAVSRRGHASLASYPVPAVRR